MFVFGCSVILGSFVERHNFILFLSLHAVKTDFFAGSIYTHFWVLFIFFKIYLLTFLVCVVQGDLELLILLPWSVLGL